MLVASPKVATYDLQPEMSAPEVTEKLVAAINEDRADFYIVNFANCDMVGHTGVFDAAVKAVEAVDDALSKVVPAILAKGGFALITADHGNADHMFDVASDGSKHPFTAHTTNRVPFIIVDEKAQLTGIEDGRLSDIAPTMLTMAGIEPSAEMTGRVLATELIENKYRFLVRGLSTTGQPSFFALFLPRHQMADGGVLGVVVQYWSLNCSIKELIYGSVSDSSVCRLGCLCRGADDSRPDALW